MIEARAVISLLQKIIMLNYVFGFENITFNVPDILSILVSLINYSLSAQVL